MIISKTRSPTVRSVSVGKYYTSSDQMDSPSTSESSPQSKRHSFPAMLSYSETLSVLSEHQRQYNDKEITRCNTPALNSKGTDEERRQKLQQAVEWLKVELKDMHHQDKFLLRQFNHLNRTIQDLKEKKELKEESEANKAKQEEESLKQMQLKKEEVKTTRLGQERYKQELLKQKQLIQQDLEQEKNKKEQLKQEKLAQEDLKQEKLSINEYDSDYGSDQSVDRFEDDCQTLKNNVIQNASPKAQPKQRNAKRWSWWK